MEILNKEIKYYSTRTLQEELGAMSVIKLIKIAHGLLEKHPVDMLVFEQKDSKLIVRSGGYRFDKPEVLDEKTVLKEYEIDVAKQYLGYGLPEKFWLKIDDYGKEYIATFLKPSEY